MQTMTHGQRIGLSERDAGKFSFLRAIRAQVFPDDRRAQEAAGFEREVSDTTKAVLGRSANGFLVPHDVLDHQRTLMTVGTANVGGNLKGTDLHPGSFIDALRNAMCVVKLGATEMGGLVGDVAIPKITTGSTATWVGEDTAFTQTNPILGQLTLTPRQVGAYVDLSRKLVVQSTPDAELLVQNDLALTIGTAVDRAALHGAGGLEPTGIIGTSGVGSVAAGTNGAAPSLALMVALETTVASANGDIGALGWLTNAKVRGKLRQIFTNATYGSDALWQQTADGGASVNGYRAMVSNQVRSDMVKNTSGAVCSGVFFGNWQDLVVATWTGIDLLVDPYSLSTKGQVRVVAIQLVDIGIRRAESFAVMSDVLTT